MGGNNMENDTKRLEWLDMIIKECTEELGEYSVDDIDENDIIGSLDFELRTAERVKELVEKGVDITDSDAMDAYDCDVVMAFHYIIEHSERDYYGDADLFKVKGW